MADEGKFVQKVWGSELWLTNEAEYCAKVLTVKPGFECSLHLHPKKAESFIVLRGTGWCVRGTQTIPLTIGAVVRIDPGVQHRFAAIDTELMLLEVSTHHSDDDVERRAESRALPEVPRMEPSVAFRRATNWINVLSEKDDF